MLEALLAASLVVALPAAWWQGVKYGIKRQQAVMPDYKQRWEETLQLMETLRNNGEIKTIEKVVEVKRLAKPARDEHKDAQLRRQLRNMWASDRVKAERMRLEHGLHPVDDLQGIWSADRQKMVATRYKYGYDEHGDKFK